MPTILPVVLVVLMCATPLFLLLRDIGRTVRRPIVTGEPPAALPAPLTPVIYVASRPIQSLR